MFIYLLTDNVIDNGSMDLNEEDMYYSDINVEFRGYNFVKILDAVNIVLIIVLLIMIVEYYSLEVDPLVNPIFSTLAFILPISIITLINSIELRRRVLLYYLTIPSNIVLFYAFLVFCDLLTVVLLIIHISHNIIPLQTLIVYSISVTLLYMISVINSKRNIKIIKKCLDNVKRSIEEDIQEYISRLDLIECIYQKAFDYSKRLVVYNTLYRSRYMRISIIQYALLFFSITFLSVVNVDYYLLFIVTILGAFLLIKYVSLNTIEAKLVKNIVHQLKRVKFTYSLFQLDTTYDSTLKELPLMTYEYVWDENSLGTNSMKHFVSEIKDAISEDTDNLILIIDDSRKSLFNNMKPYLDEIKCNCIIGLLSLITQSRDLRGSLNLSLESNDKVYLIAETLHDPTYQLLGLSHMWNEYLRRRKLTTIIVVNTNVLRKVYDVYFYVSLNKILKIYKDVNFNIKYLVFYMPRKDNYTVIEKYIKANIPSY